MKKHWKITPVLALALSLVFAMAIPSFTVGYDTAKLNTAANKMAVWLQKELPVDDTDLEADNDLDWAVIAFARSGQNGYGSYMAHIKKVIETNYAKLSLTDHARIALAAGAKSGTAIISGKDLLKAIAAWDFEKETMTGSIAYSLLALNATDYPAAAQKEKLISLLKDAQREDGSYNYLLKADPANTYSLAGDVDSTAMVLTALAPYKTRDALKPTVDKALAYMKGKQLPSAGFDSWGAESADSTAQTIIALCSLGFDPLGSDYGKGTNNMLDALLAFQNEDGGIKGYDGKSNIMSTYQALCAIGAYQRFATGRSPLFVYAAETSTTAPPTTKPTTTAAWVDQTPPGDSENPKIPNTGSGMAIFAALIPLLGASVLLFALKRKKEADGNA